MTGSGSSLISTHVGNVVQGTLLGPNAGSTLDGAESERVSSSKDEGADAYRFREPVASDVLPQRGMLSQRDVSQRVHRTEPGARG